MNYRVEILPAALKELEILPDPIYKKVVDTIENFKHDPRPANVLKLKGHQYRWRARIGMYRILFEIDDSLHRVIIFRIRHRKDVYR